MKITLFTGSGASKPFGYPTTVEFFPPAQELSQDQRDMAKHLIQYLKNPTLDVEIVLSLLEPAEEFLKSSPGGFVGLKLRDQWSNKISQFTKFLRERCFQLYGKSPDEKEVANIYKPLLEFAGWRENRVSFFTVNYDPITDFLMNIADNSDIPAYDGFKPRGAWDKLNYRKKKAGLDIYRLHGSMSWVQQGMHVINTRDYSLRSGATKHLIIYPGYKGNPEDEAIEVFNYPHKMLRENLENTNYFIVIGFSFRDNHLNKLIQQSFKKNNSLKLYILNPEWPTGENDFLNKLKETYSNRIIHINEAFGSPEAIPYLRNEILEAKVI